MEAPPPAEQGAILTPPPPLGETPENAPKTQDDAATSFIESVRKVFAPCVGVVDAASILMGNCRFGKEAYDNGAGDGLAMRLKTGAMHKVGQKRQGETLEIPANGGFDDDVSAISAHTLEEMERLRQVHQKSKLQMLTPNNGSSRNPKVPPYRPRGSSRSDLKATRGAFTSKQLWTMSRPPMGHHDVEESSIGVSTSGSSSAEDEPPRISTRGNKRNGKKGPKIAQRMA